MSFFKPRLHPYASWLLVLHTVSPCTESSLSRSFLRERTRAQSTGLPPSEHKSSHRDGSMSRGRNESRAQKFSGGGGVSIAYCFPGLIAAHSCDLPSARHDANASAWWAERSHSTSERSTEMHADPLKTYGQIPH